RGFGDRRIVPAAVVGEYRDHWRGERVRAVSGLQGHLYWSDIIFGGGECSLQVLNREGWRRWGADPLVLGRPPGRPAHFWNVIPCPTSAIGGSRADQGVRPPCWLDCVFSCSLARGLLPRRTGASPATGRPIRRPCTRPALFTSPASNATAEIRRSRNRRTPP